MNLEGNYYGNENKDCLKT